MTKDNDTTRNPQGKYSMAFHQALEALGQINDNEAALDLLKHRPVNSFKSLAEILGAQNDDKPIIQDNKRPK